MVVTSSTHNYNPSQAMCRHGAWTFAKGEQLETNRMLESVADPRERIPAVSGSNLLGDMTDKEASADTASYLTLLLGRMSVGEEAAMSLFYEATLARSWAMVLRIVGKREAAEDVLADAYLQVWRKAGDYDHERGHPMAWLLMICRSRAIDYLRRLDQAQSRDDIELFMDQLDEQVENAPDVTDLGADPMDVLAQRQQVRQLGQAMQALEKPQRLVLALAYFKGLTHSEIADHTALPLGTVKTHIRQGLLQIKKFLGQEGFA